MVTGPQRQERRRRSRHAGREKERVGTALQPRQQAFDLVPARIVLADIGASAAVFVVGIAFIGRRHMDRRNERLGGRIDPAECLGAEGLGGKVVVGHDDARGKETQRVAKLGDAGNKKARDPTLSPIPGTTGKECFPGGPICFCRESADVAARDDHRFNCIRKTRTRQSIPSELGTPRSQGSPANCSARKSTKTRSLGAGWRLLG